MNNNKRFYFLLNLFLAFLIGLESAGTIALNFNYLQDFFTQTSAVTQNPYQKTAIKTQKEKINSANKKIAEKQPSPAAAKLKISSTTPVQTPIPTAALSEPSLIPSPELSNETTDLALNYFSLGEKSVFGSTAPNLQTKLLSDNSQNSSNIFAGKIKTVFVIVMENANWSNILGNLTAAPFINEVLLPQASYADNYYNPVGVHPSEPNYIWLEAGSNLNLDGRKFTTDDDPSPGNSTDTQDHLTTLLNKKNISWKTYAQSIDGSSCPVKSEGVYGAKHNPAVFFHDVSDNEQYCISHERPMDELFSDLLQNTTARYNLVIPDLCNDMHDSCPPINYSVKQGDKWLSLAMPKILDSNAYKDGGLILITWDEGENDSDGPIGLIAISPLAKGNGYADTTYYTHSSTLKTIEEIFGLPFLRDSQNATDLSDLFIQTPPDVSLSLAVFNFFPPLKIPNLLTEQ